MYIRPALDSAIAANIVEIGEYRIRAFPFRMSSMLFEPLFVHARNQPHEIAVIDDHGQYTFQQLAAMAAGMSMYLGAQTRKPNVGLLLPPSVGFVASFYATLLAGKSAVLINYLLGDKEI